ncbi:MAG: AmmeMemoRadiSam system protein A [Campylobacterota bacterium]
MEISVEQVLLEVARNSILSEFENSFSINKEMLLEKFPILKEQRACFVTLNSNGKLRGCIGSLVAHKNLLDDVISNAYNAAFSDMRFNRLTPLEFKNIDIEISVLTPAVKLPYESESDLREKITPNEHGVILELDGKRATFLPQVWEQLPTFDEFFTQLSKKAGFSKNCIENKPTIYTYTAIKIK